jgi:hypothetical protein
MSSHLRHPGWYCLWSPGKTDVLAALWMAAAAAVVFRMPDVAETAAAAVLRRSDVTETDVTKTGVTKTGVTKTGVTETGVTETGVTETGVTETGET